MPKLSRHALDLVVFSSLAACTAGELPTLGAGQISETERTRLRALGIEDVYEAEGRIVLAGAGEVVLGHVDLRDSGGYDVTFEGAGAAIEPSEGQVTWSCDDGHTASAPSVAGSLETWVAGDPSLTARCGRALAAGWVASGIFRAPPAGCSRVLVDGEARIVCEPSDSETGVSSQALLCGGGDFGYEAFECVDSGSGCSAACWDCTDSWSVSVALDCEAGGLGGDSGSTLACRDYNTTQFGFGVDETSEGACASAALSAQRACPSVWGCNLLASVRSTRPTQRIVGWQCDAWVDCRYSPGWWPW